MPVTTRLGALSTLQSAQAAAANGTALDITDATSVLVEISGTYTGITANFEASLDGGATWNPVALEQLGSVTRARLALGVANGLYLLENAGGLTSFRARTTVAVPTGSMTVRGMGARV